IQGNRSPDSFKSNRIWCEPAIGMKLNGTDTWPGEPRPAVKVSSSRSSRQVSLICDFGPPRPCTPVGHANLSTCATLDERASTVNNSVPCVLMVPLSAIVEFLLQGFSAKKTPARRGCYRSAALACRAPDL